LATVPSQKDISRDWNMSPSFLPEENENCREYLLNELPNPLHSGQLHEKGADNEIDKICDS